MSVLKKHIQNRLVSVCVAIVFFLGVLSIMPIVNANDANYKSFAKVNIAFIETQISQLKAAIVILQENTLTEQEFFEKISEPSFAAIDAVLNKKGYTVQSFYQFQFDHDVLFSQWLDENESKKNLIEKLTAEKKGLLLEYDRLLVSVTQKTKDGV